MERVVRMSVLENLEPQPVLKHFEAISSIPRCSGNEQAISDYLVEFAKENGLKVYQDEVLNVYIRKNASPGYENMSPVILQGHMDMVCEKNGAVIHDFSKDPLKLKVEEDYLTAEGTTLGADDGIAVAYCMAILESDDIQHPPLEVIITTQEETGLVGASKVDGSKFGGKTLINIDGEKEGVFLVSCAGGTRTKLFLPLNKKKQQKKRKRYSLEIGGLKGGHSGADIDLGRLNANCLMGRLLNDLKKEIKYYLYSVEGGSKMNAIPRESAAKIGIKTNRTKSLEKFVERWEEKIGQEYGDVEPDFHLQLKHEGQIEKRPLSKKIRNRIIHILMTLPNGINTMSPRLKGLVESSNNLGVVTFQKEQIVFENAVRSSSETRKKEILNHMQEIADFTKAEIITDVDYPGWEYSEHSPVRELMRKVYEEKYDKEPVITAIHAGLECGILMDVIGQLDMISIGPDMEDVHTPDERISLSSVKRTYEFLLETLRKTTELNQ